MRHLPPQHVRRRQIEVSSALLKGAILFMLIIVVGDMAVFQSALFRVRHISVQGEKTYRARVFALASARLPYTFSFTSTAKELMLRRFSEIETANIQTNLITRALQVSYTLRQPFLRWCPQSANSTCFLVDKTGFIFAPFTAQSGIPTFNDEYYQGIAVGKRIPSVMIASVDTLLRELTKHSISAFSFDLKAPFSLTIKTTLAPEIRISLEQDLASQLSALFLFLTDGKTDITKLTSIDLRIPNKIYYR